MVEQWEKHKWIFEPDGSLLDIYVQETELEDWLILIDFLNADYKIKYAPTFENEFDNKINKDYITKLLLDQTGELERRTVSIFSGNLFFNCHFFLEDEIEFDTEPGAIKVQEDFETLISFMNAVSKALNKEIILTPENSPKFPLITINQKQGISKILCQDELSKLHKNGITWIGRLRGLYVFSLMRLLPKLKQSKFRNWLSDYVIGLTGANRPHTASKKKTN